MWTRLFFLTCAAAAIQIGCKSESNGGIELPDAGPDPDPEPTEPAEVDASADASVSPLDAGALPATEEAGIDAAAALDAAVSDSGPVVNAPMDAGQSEPAPPDAASNPGISDAGDAGNSQPPTDPGELDAGWPSEPSCLFQSEPVPFPELPEGIDAGPDAGPPPGPHIQIGDNPFIGPYLMDHAGFALYIFTADFPGDCNVAPVSTCFEDCAIAWPIFEAGDRVLGEGLDDARFGTFERPDGSRQTTYDGWPLYYYKRDVAPLDVLGQGKGDVWFLAEPVMPNLVIMRAPEELMGIKYLADGRGRTLYMNANDVVGSESQPPIENCDELCQEHFEPFQVRALRPVTSLEPNDLAIFVRADGSTQVSFRGQPLYLSRDEVQSGQMLGSEVEDFSVVLP